MPLPVFRRFPILPGLLAALAVALAGVAGLTFGWRALDNWERGEYADQFELQNRAVVDGLRERLTDYAQALRAARGLIAVQPETTQARWQAFAAALDLPRNYPGLQAVAYAPRVAGADLSRFIARRRSEGAPTFDLRSPGIRKEYLPVTYVEPLTWRNEQALGFDLSIEPSRRLAAARAGDSGDLTISDPVVLITESGEAAASPGFLMLLPFYAGGGVPASLDQRRNRLAGYVFVVVRMADFAPFAVAAKPAGITLRVYDRDATGASSPLIYDSHPDLARDALVRQQREILSFGGQRWELVFHATPEWETTIDHHLADLALAGGLVATLLLALLVGHLSIARSWAERRARAMTAELRASEERFSLAAAATRDGIWDRNLATGEVYVSPRVLEMVGLPPGTALRIEDMAERIHPDDLPRWQAAVADHLARHQPYAIEYRARMADGSWRWFESRGQAVWAEQGGRPVRMVGTITDVTARKEMEERLDRYRSFLSRLLDVAPVPIAVKDGDQRYVFANRAYAELLRVPAEGLIGRTAGEALPSEAATAIDEAERRLLTSGQDQVFEISLPVRGGRRSLVVKKTATSGVEGEPLVLASYADVTEIRQALDRFSAVIEGTPLVAVQSFNREGAVLMWNRASESLFGFASRQVLGSRLRSVFSHADDGDRFEEMLERVWTTGLAFGPREVSVAGPTGPIWLLATIFPVIRNGIVADVFAMEVDISERIRMEAALREGEERFRDLTELSSDWFWEQDAELRFTALVGTFNQAGVDAERVVGRRRWELASDPDDPIWAAHRATLEARQAFRGFEYPMTGADGQVHWFSIDGRPLFDEEGQFLGYRGTSRDITERKRIEEELRRHRDHLQELVAEQTAGLQRAKEAAERADEAKTRFLANMSHELRTPMHAILSFARLGTDRAGQTDPERLRGWFANIHDSGDRLLALLNDLLDMAKIEAGKLVLNLEPLALEPLAREVAAGIGPLLDSQALSVEWAVTPVPAVTGDRLRLGQVIRNLLSNAIKFTPSGRQLVIEIAPAELDGRAAVRLSVLDEGVGIPDEELAAVFDKFVQSSRTRTGAGGTGLGLALSRDIVEAHQGRIMARNRTGGGAAFDVLLPADTERN